MNGTELPTDASDKQEVDLQQQQKITYFTKSQNSVRYSIIREPSTVSR